MKTKDGILYFPPANFAGEGFDIYGRYDVQSSSITPLFDPLKAGTNSFNFLGQEYALPDYILGAESTSVYYREDTATTRESFQNSIATNCEVHGSYGAFSGQMEASYGRQFASSGYFSYSYRNFFSNLGRLQIILDNPERYLTDNLLIRIAQLPDTVNENNLPEFADFFDDFGIYFVSELNLGGALEYYAAVSNSSRMETIDIAASVRMEYKALFVSGGVSADTKSSQSWQSYTSNRTVQILAKGGDPTLLARLTGTDPDQPSDYSVSVYNQWLDSIKTDPAVTDFKLTGIWELCGSKRNVVEDAFYEYGRKMRPRLIIHAYENGPLPSINLGSEIVPTHQPTTSYGWQMVVIDRSDISINGVRLNKYYGYNSTGSDWYDEVVQMYNEMLNDLRQNNLDNSNYVFILANRTLNGGALPPSGFQNIMRSAGGGDALFEWFDRANAGFWGDFISYAQVGIFDFGPATGVSAIGWELAANKIELETFFYRQPNSTKFTLGAGSVRVNVSRKKKGTKKAPKVKAKAKTA